MDQPDNGGIWEAHALPLGPVADESGCWCRVAAICMRRSTTSEPNVWTAPAELATWFLLAICKSISQQQWRTYRVVRTFFGLSHYIAL